MARRTIARIVMTGMFLGAFGLGYVCGTVSQPRADAQGLGGLLDQAGKGGGALAAVSQLGTSITEMQEHVSGLQKGLDSLRKVQSALTGK